MNIFLTNDDGMEAAGLQALIQAVSSWPKLTRLFVVAPDREQSACAHSMTLDGALRVQQVAEGRFAVSGTPADCVSLGLSTLINEKIDILFSGINHGANLGSDVARSGTVSGAMQAVEMGVPALSLSLAYNRYAGEEPNFAPVVAIAAKWADIVLHEGLPEGTLLNINVPNVIGAENSEEMQQRITTMGQEHYSWGFEKRRDSLGGECYWNTWNRLKRDGADDDEESDLAAVAAGDVSVTPIQLDFTNRNLLQEMRRWPL